MVVSRLVEHVPVGSPKKKENKADKKHKAMKVHLDIKSARGLSRAGRRARNSYCTVKWDMHEVPTHPPLSIRPMALSEAHPLAPSHTPS